MTTKKVLVSISFVFFCLLLFITQTYAHSPHHEHTHEHPQEEHTHDKTQYETKATKYAIDLTPESFDSIVYTDTPALVAFTAPWCGVCQKMKPELLRIAKAFKDESVIIANADVEKYPIFGTRFGITSFPTITYIPGRDNSTSIPYELGRSGPELSIFLNSKLHTYIKLSEPPSLSITLEHAHLYNLIHQVTTPKSISSALILFYAPWCEYSTRFAPAWEDIANSYMTEDTLTVARFNGDINFETTQAQGVSRYPTLKYYSAKYKNGIVVNEDTLAGVVKFIQTESGIARDSRGKYLKTYGRIQILDELAYKFADVATNESHSTEKLKELFLELENVISSLNQDDAQLHTLYIAMAKHILEKGWQFPYIEVDRLVRILDRGTLAIEDRRVIAKRVNISRAFQYYQ